MMTIKTRQRGTLGSSLLDLVFPLAAVAMVHSCSTTTGGGGSPSPSEQ
jgi:hypothetical protein